MPYYAKEIKFFDWSGSFKYECKGENSIWKMYNSDYRGYKNLIDQIIEINEKKEGYKISHEDFDHLLWYYFKGNQRRLEKAKVAYDKEIKR